jgi:hypothetical protein
MHLLLFFLPSPQTSCPRPPQVAERHSFIHSYRLHVVVHSIGYSNLGYWAAATVVRWCKSANAAGEGNPSGHDPADGRESSISTTTTTTTSTPAAD